MRAIYYETFGSPPQIEELPDPKPTPDGVVLQVKASGLCRSDWHGWMGHDKDITLPHVPGHELAGEVLEVGKEVRRWKKGDRVTVPFVGGCGTCPDCLGGDQQVCANQFQPGFTHWGSFADYVAIQYADTNLVRVPETISDAAAAALGCRFATSFRAVVDQAQVKGGQWVAILGCGGVGLSAIMIAHAIGAQVLAVDIDETKLELARQMGAAVGLHAQQVPDLPEAIRSLTGGGVHVAIDALGHPDLVRDGMLSLRRRGKHIQVGLLSPASGDPTIPMSKIIAYELELLGSHGMQAWRYPAMLDLITSGKVDINPLIRRTISLEDAVGELIRMDQFEGAGIQVIDLTK